MGVDLEIYILPLPRKYIPRSTSVDNRIFLSPGVYEFGREIVAYIVSHEFGHCFQNHYLPLQDLEGWNRYLTLRGVLGDSRYTPSSAHAFQLCLSRSRPSRLGHPRLLLTESPNLGVRTNSPV